MPNLEDIVVHFQRVHIFALATGIIVLLNLFTIQRPLPKPFPNGKPLVSVLVPVRNEERTIGKCLRSLLAQDYPYLEILVWDDCSTDRTREILVAIQDTRFRWIAGTEPTPRVAGEELVLLQPCPKGSGRNPGFHRCRYLA